MHIARVLSPAFARREAILVEQLSNFLSHCDKNVKFSIYILHIDVHDVLLLSYCKYEILQGKYFQKPRQRCKNLG